MSSPLERFIASYYRLHPVNATFSGIHDYDDLLPDWSPTGLEVGESAMREAHAGLGGAKPTLTSFDGDLARGYLEIRLAEDSGSHGVRRNPSIWTGEAVAAPISLMLRPSAPMRKRAASVAARLEKTPAFLKSAREVLGGAIMPEAWVEQALRDCAGAEALLSQGVLKWVKWLPRSSTAGLAANLLTVSADTLADRVIVAAAAARAAFAEFATWLRSRPATKGVACGPDLFDLLLTRAHFTARTRAEILSDARATIADAHAKLDETAKAAAGTWAAARDRLQFAHPAPQEYLAAFERTWTQCRMKAERHDLITWPDWPIRYVLLPEWAQGMGPQLAFFPYRAPAPEDSVRAHDYLVAPIDPANPEQHLRTWNHAVIKVNHVIRHGGLGHHVRNWFAYNKCTSPIGRVAAVDCATRIGMSCAATIYEGWGAYAIDVMEEVGFLTPLEKAAAAWTRVLSAARAIVDIELHQGSMGFDDAVRFLVEKAELPREAAVGAATRASMFPGIALARWLGAREIHELRTELKQSRAGFALKAFHEELLGYGSVPVALTARRMRTA
jgi:hypothetical protein